MLKGSVQHIGIFITVRAAVLWLGVRHSEAVSISEVEPNNTLGTAQNIDSFFSLDFDENIGDTGSNTSTTIPHVTISGSGNGTFDYYTFTVATGGSLGIFDIDFGSPGGPGDIDTELFLYTLSGTVLRFNDDAGITRGALGSTSVLDAYIQFTFLSPATYVIGVCRFDCIDSGTGVGMTGNTPDLGELYTLQVSIAGHPVVPEPATLLLLGFGIVGMGAVARRRHRRK